MSLEPLWQAGWVVTLHALMAMAALPLGALQLAMAKGTMRHRLVGFAWIGLMAGISISSFFIHDFRVIGPFSPIHLLSILVLWTLAQALLAVRAGDIKAHRRNMTQLYVLALIVTGGFTLWPGRVMHQVLFG